MSARKKLSPRKARTFNQICSLNRDNLSSKHGWIVVDDEGSVTIAEQANGCEAKGIVRLPRREFNRLVDWYNKEQELRPRSR